MFTAAGKSAAASAANYIEDVFSTYLYTGNGSTQTITNGIDLSGKGGLVWIKSRSAATNNFLFDTVRGTTDELNTNTTDAEASLANSLTAFNSDGFSIGSATGIGVNAATYVSWTFRKQAKFFDVVTYTGNGTAGRTVSHNLGSTPGVIIVKRTDGATNWRVYHRSLGATQYLDLDETVAAGTATTIWNDTSPTSTVFSVGTNSGVNASGGTYVAYLFAHNAGGFGASGTDNVISCGSFTPSVGAATITLGYEPQWILFKNSATGGDNWVIVDVMRNLSLTGQSFLYPNSSAAEVATSGWIAPTATGFQMLGSATNSQYIYIAIRRGPMRTPTSGTSVYTPVTWTATAAAATVTGFNFPVDLCWHGQRANVFGTSNVTSWDRLRGAKQELFTGLTDAELTRNGVTGFDYMSALGVSNPTAVGEVNYNVGNTEIFWGFRRAPGFFDVVCYTGTGVARTVSHNLGVAPELIIVKVRSTINSWLVYAAPLGATKRLFLSDTSAEATSSAFWNNTAPTASVFTVGTADGTNLNAGTFVSYLFSTVAGVSKVGSYTGTGTTQVINCGFTAGSRFVMIKRTDSTGDWYVWDSARGIVAGNDPYLLLNSTAAEVTSTDYVDTANSGFEISSTAPAAINANGGTFIFLAIA